MVVSRYLHDKRRVLLTRHTHSSHSSQARALIRQSVDLDKDLVDLSNLWFASAFMLKKSPTRRTIHEFKGAVDLSISFLDRSLLSRPR